MAIFDFIGDILGVGANLLGAGMQSGAAKDAAQIQASAADQASAEARRQFDVSRADMAPWMQSGRNSLRRLDALLGTSGTYNQAWNRANNEYLAKFNEYNALAKTPYSPARDQRMRDLAAEVQRLQGEVNGLNPADFANSGELMRDFSLADFQADPGYQFRLGEGAKAIENSAAARGMQLSGPTLKALARFGQDFASNEYDQAWNRDSLEKQRKFNFLTGQSGTGLQTAGNVGALGAGASNQVADNYLQAANAQASGRVGSANAWGNAINDVTGYYRMRNLLKG